jgi:nucleoid-associated protein YejK
LIKELELLYEYNKERLRIAEELELSEGLMEMIKEFSKKLEGFTKESDNELQNYS